MPSDVEQIKTIRSQTLAVLADVTALPKPTYVIDGQHVHWGEYLDRLRETVAWCDRQLAGEEPFEIRSQGTS